MNLLVYFLELVVVVAAAVEAEVLTRRFD